MAHRREVSRIEGFSDAVFAFAITLLVVSLEVPKTFHELMDVMRGFPAFLICFVMLFQVWWRHYRFFRDYDLEDATVITLTGALLFVVLFYVYPLKFVWSLALGSFAGQRITSETIQLRQVPILFYIYGGGIIAVFSILALMHAHAYRLRRTLGLTAEEALKTRVRVMSNAGVAGVAVLSIGLAAAAAAFAPQLVGFAGFVYGAIGIVEWSIGSWHARERAKLAASTADTSPV